MSDKFYTNKQNKVDYQTIILTIYQRIMELSAVEWIGGYHNTTFSGNVVEKNYITDKRAEFSQAIETLADSLYSRFDVKMKKEFEDYENDLKKLEKKYSDDEGFLNSDEKTKFSIKKLILIKNLFRNLSCLLHRLDYLKASSYMEDSLEDVDLVEVDNK